MFCIRVIVAASALVGVNLTHVALAQDELPRSTDPRLKIELFAESPQIVTPTGIDVDYLGRVWAIESNTHFPPEGYAGHPTDRVLVMQDTDKDGKADKITVFKDGLTHTMSVAVKPVWLDVGPFHAKAREIKPGAAPGQAIEVFIATRRAIFLCTDTNGDLICDDVKQLVRLETTGNYPHNGLAGLAFDGHGRMFFGFGENLGADYQIIGSDGMTLSGGGEGGNIYRCEPDGSKLERWATGFWNPHASCFDAFGHLFTLDNDPDSRPPCRLLQIVECGDYGYRFRNGRKGTHPFTAWNGEIPGTLPMVSGTGEAPSGIVCYESDGFPRDYVGTLLAGSWGDHRIDKFVLNPRGESFESFPQPIIKGGENFRPVGLAVAPDGSVYLTDWVSKEYKLHGLGRIWRVSSIDEPTRVATSIASLRSEKSAAALAEILDSPVLDVRRLAARLLSETESGRKSLETLWDAEHGENDRRRLFEILHSGAVPAGMDFHRDFDEVDLSDPFVLTQAINKIRKMFPAESALKELLDEAAKRSSSDHKEATSPVEFRQLAILLAARASFAKDRLFVKSALQIPTPSIRRMAIQWIGEEHLNDLRPEVDNVLASEPMTTELFMACLATLSLLDGVPPAEFERNPPAQYMLSIVTNATRPATLRATALRMLSPTQKELDGKLLGEMLDSPDPGLRREVVHTLQHSLIPERHQLLRAIAADQSLDMNFRADAVAGLAGGANQSGQNGETRDLLLSLAFDDKNPELQLEAIRSLRGQTSAPQEKSNPDDRVAEGLKTLQTKVSMQSEPMRRKLSAALEFAIGPRPNVATGPILKEAGAADIKSPLAADETARLNAVDSGRRTFFHVNSAGCYKCHQIGGRGGQVGPDLTVIARTMDRAKLIESILAPGKEISPQFTTWAIETTTGKVVTGMLLGEEVNGDLRLGNNLGEVVHVPFKEIESRSPLKTSIMPGKLSEAMTTAEFLDLISFLETLK
jgi:putative membrane-bound dehydrogenase-like protein